MKRTILQFSCLCLLLSLAGCEPKKAPLPPADANTYFPIQLGQSQLQLQLALTQPQQQKGLMRRDSLEKDHGMLFLFPQTAKKGFWMQNTRIPLDIGYFDAEGQLLEIHKLYPHDETPVQSSNDQVLIAIETNRGWYARNEVKPGDQINMADLLHALQRRRHNHPILSE